MYTHTHLHTHNIQRVEVLSEHNVFVIKKTRIVEVNRNVLAQAHGYVLVTIKYLCIYQFR